MSSPSSAPPPARRYFVVSHTHWDREWYEPFQLFRLRLVRALDSLLDILARDPAYAFFTLDGQTVVLEDYGEVRPDRLAELRAHIERGRVLVGPWYILPDEFLVSGEAIIRNLARGLRTAESWGRAGVMRVGYIPDPFGHIGQMPQLLRGFGIDSAIFRRGLADEPVELEWEAPDGSRVFTIYLRDSYDNAAWLPHDPDAFAGGLDRLGTSLAPHQRTPDLLLMNGTDHMEPWPDLTSLLAHARVKLPAAEVLHSTLPAYLAQVRADLAAGPASPLPLVKGELRNPKRHHLLPGVLSARTWIKIRNAAAQDALEKWAEPLTAWREAVAAGDILPEPRAALNLAWKYLLQNQPHDSICGCSIDQVHTEMRPRFDAVAQISSQIIIEAGQALLSHLNTTSPGAFASVVVLNPNGRPAHEAQRLSLELPLGVDSFVLRDDRGEPVPSVVLGRETQHQYSLLLDREGLERLLASIQAGQTDGLHPLQIELDLQRDPAAIDVTLSRRPAPAPASVQAAVAAASAQLLASPSTRFHVQAHSPVVVDLLFLARDLPPHGYRTFTLSPAGSEPPTEPAPSPALTLENQVFKVEIDPQDGSLSLLVKQTGEIMRGLNRFVDTGDRGDLYNYDPPTGDSRIDRPAAPPLVEWRENNVVRQRVAVRSTYRIPAALLPSRAARASDLAPLDVVTTLTLTAGVPRLDLHVEVFNQSRDHRLRVHFPTSVRAREVLAGQAFDTVRRSIELPAATQDWIEQPMGTAPMQDWVSLEGPRGGLLLAARGLAEYEALGSHENFSENQGTELALTLLRCVEWLSRGDLSTRKGDAGPELRTPGAQELGRHEFDYALVPYSPGEHAAAVALAAAFLSPPRSIAAAPHPGQLPPAPSFVRVEPPQFILTAIKPTQTGAGLVLRGFNSGESAVEVQLEFFRPFEGAALVSLDEREPAPLALEGGRLARFTARAKEIVTLRIG